MSPLIDPEAIQRAEQIGLQARSIVEGYLAGAHRSPFRGFAIEFAQHREYVPGDDTRHLDWKVLGRSDRYYIKQYEQETNYVAHILVDGSESMRYGSGKVTKLDYAKTMAACLAYLVLLQRDAVAVSLFDTEIREHVPRTDSMGKMQQICTQLARFQPTEKSNVKGMLIDLARRVTRRGIVILISDLFEDEQAVLEGIQQLRLRRHEVIVLQVLDPAEVSFPFSGNVEFIGLEGQGRLLTQPSDVRAAYRAEFDAFLETIRVGCERNGCACVKIETSQSWPEVLSAYLAVRSRQGRLR
jgi:uncharacterized protein (DUF58 family)